MILNFLQTRNPPVLPCLHKRPHQRLLGADGKPSAFADDLVSLRGFGHKNKESLGELLFHFYRRYAHELDYERNVISIREGTLISKEEKKWHLMQNNRLCVEEPFNTERNLGNTADDISFRGVHLELRRAFDLISEAKLNECMEQYVFPAVEEKIWEKPPPKPPPILSRSQSQSGRGGRGGASNRGGRHTLNQGRRASSAAASNKFPNPPTMLRTIALWEQPLQASYDQFQLHEKLISDYQLLQAQEHELRRVQAQAQLQAQLQAQGSHQMTSSTQQTAGTAPLRPTHTAYPFPYSPAHVASQQAIHTNPPSPSMKSALPELRRSVHRTVTPADSAAAGLRSHSQPARPLPMALPVPNTQNLFLNGYSLQQYQQLRQQQLYNYLESQGRLSHAEVPTQSPFQTDSRFEENMPKEYIGYYVHDSPSCRGSQIDVGVRPAYNDIPYRIRGMPHGLGRFGDPSRSPSPSPSTPYRDRSTSILSAASAPPGPMQTDRTTVPASNLRTSGPIIVDGSDVWAPSENAARAELPSDRGVLNGAGLGMDSRRNRSPLVDERYHRSGRSETIASMPYRQQISFHSPDGSHGFDGDAQSPNLDPKPRRTYPQVNGTAPAPVTTQLQVSTMNEYGLGIESLERTPKSGTRSPQRDFSAASPAQSPSVSKKHESTEQSNPAYETLKALPLLSPVREVRTPSPTANRKDDNAAELRSTNRLARKYQLQAIPPYSHKADGKDKQAQQSTPRPNGLSVASSSNVQAAQPSTNGWQQTSSKKNKKNKSKGSGSYSNITPLGEPLPANEAERKGG